MGSSFLSILSCKIVFFEVKNIVLLALLIRPPYLPHRGTRRKAGKGSRRRNMQMMPWVPYWKFMSICTKTWGEVEATRQGTVRPGFAALVRMRVLRTPAKASLSSVWTSPQKEVPTVALRSRWRMRSMAWLA